MASSPQPEPVYDDSLPLWKSQESRLPSPRSTQDPVKEDRYLWITLPMQPPIRSVSNNAPNVQMLSFHIPSSPSPSQTYTPQEQASQSTTQWSSNGSPSPGGTPLAEDVAEGGASRPRSLSLVPTEEDLSQATPPRTRCSDVERWIENIQNEHFLVTPSRSPRLSRRQAPLSPTSSMSGNEADDEWSTPASSQDTLSADPSPFKGLTASQESFEGGLQRHGSHATAFDLVPTQFDLLGAPPSTQPWPVRRDSIYSFISAASIRQDDSNDDDEAESCYQHARNLHNAEYEKETEGSDTETETEGSVANTEIAGTELCSTSGDTVAADNWESEATEPPRSHSGTPMLH